MEEERGNKGQIQRTKIEYYFTDVEAICKVDKTENGNSKYLLPYLSFHLENFHPEKGSYDKM